MSDEKAKARRRLVGFVFTAVAKRLNAVIPNEIDPDEGWQLEVNEELDEAIRAVDGLETALGACEEESDVAEMRAVLSLLYAGILGSMDVSGPHLEGSEAQGGAIWAGGYIHRLARSFAAEGAE